jgi:hypothetical protein
MPFRTKFANGVKTPALLLLSAAVCFSTAAAAQSKPSPSTPASSTTSHATPTRATTTAPPSTSNSHNNNNNNNNNQNQNHRNRRYPYYPYAYGVTAPSDYNSANSANNPTDDSQCQGGGPTIFDRCGSGPPSYPPAANTGPAHRQTQSAASHSPDSAPGDSTPTTLIFKDGHQIEVGNYAIVGHTLYDLTPGHSNKVALTDLDLDATKKQNGPDFEIAHSSQSN